MDQPFILISVASKQPMRHPIKASENNKRSEGLFEVMYPAASSASNISRFSYAFKAEKWLIQGEAPAEDVDVFDHQKL